MPKHSAHAAPLFPMSANIEQKSPFKPWYSNHIFETNPFFVSFSWKNKLITINVTHSLWYFGVFKERVHATCKRQEVGRGVGPFLWAKLGVVSVIAAKIRGLRPVQANFPKEFEDEAYAISKKNGAVHNSLLWLRQGIMNSLNFSNNIEIKFIDKGRHIALPKGVEPFLFQIHSNQNCWQGETFHFINEIEECQQKSPHGCSISQLQHAFYKHKGSCSWTSQLNESQKHWDALGSQIIHWNKSTLVVSKQAFVCHT